MTNRRSFLGCLAGLFGGVAATKGAQSSIPVPLSDITPGPLMQSAVTGAYCGPQLPEGDRQSRYVPPAYYTQYDHDDDDDY